MTGEDVLRASALRIRRRGAVLCLLGAVDIGYGAALLGSLHHQSKWWPAYAEYFNGIPTTWWGYVWIVVGLFLLTGVFLKRDAYHYAADVLLKGFWAASAIEQFTVAANNGEDIYNPAGWGPACIYIGYAGMVLICSGWKEVTVIGRQ